MKKILAFSWLIVLIAILPACQESADKEMAADGVSGATRKSKSNMMATSNSDWWPNQLNLAILRQNSELSNPNAEDFNYIEAFNSLDYDALKADIRAVLTDSQD